MLLLEGLHLHIASARALGGSGKARWAEAGLLAVHISGYLTAVFVVLSPRGRWCSSFSSRVCSGSTWEPRSPNHKGMPVVGQDEKVDFLRRQALTSHNIRGSLLTDLALGGLTTRLSITCSRPCRGRVCVTPTRPCGGSAPSTAFLHTQTGLLVSYAQVLRHLHTTDRTAGPEPAADTAAADPDAGP